MRNPVPRSAIYLTRPGPDGTRVPLGAMALELEGAAALLAQSATGDIQLRSLVVLVEPADLQERCRQHPRSRSVCVPESVVLNQEEAA